MTASTITDQQMTAAAETGPRRSPSMPPVHPWAWHGPLGEAVQQIAPTTEADPIAILFQAMALFGGMVGDGPHVELGSQEHPPRIWPLIVGKTGSGRKGTSLAEARMIARSWGPYAGKYLDLRQMGGLSSGEGLLASLGAKPPKGQDGPEHEAQAPDGKLTVTETEFARVLTSSKRDGSTLGPVLRQMWDGGSAAVMTRTAPLKVDGAHLVTLAHITPKELRLKLADSDLAGGTLNRFLVIASERTQLLPYDMERPDLAHLGRPIAAALEDVRGWRQRIRLDREARALWADVYRALSIEEPDGVLGSVMARGPAQTQRLALCCCLLDGSSSLSKSHLLTGLALWHYASASARWLFWEQEATSPERRLAEYLVGSEEGRTRTEINRLFSGNKTAEELDSMLHQALSRRLIAVSIDDSGGGRRAVRYRWTGGALDPVGQILDAYW